MTARRPTTDDHPSDVLAIPDVAPDVAVRRATTPTRRLHDVSTEAVVVRTDWLDDWRTDHGWDRTAGDNVFLRATPEGDG